VQPSTSTSEQTWRNNVLYRTPFLSIMQRKKPAGGQCEPPSHLHVSKVGHKQSVILHPSLSNPFPSNHSLSKPSISRRLLRLVSLVSLIIIASFPQLPGLKNFKHDALFRNNWLTTDRAEDKQRTLNVYIFKFYFGLCCVFVQLRR
jgi:hypothetical protein